MRSRGEDEDDKGLNLLPSSSAFDDAAAARAADPLGLNEGLWEKGWEEGKLYSSATPADAATVDDPTASPHPSDEEGASDFSDEDERAAYVSVRRASRIERQGQERKKELEERRLARIKALEEAAGPSSSSSTQPARGPASLSKATFNLMVKTAAAVRAATKPKQLELRILTHHGGDERFAFLRRNGGRANEVWERLKAGETLKWEDVDESEEAESRRKGVAQAAGLLSGYDSESESEGERRDDAPAVGKIDTPQEHVEDRNGDASSPPGAAAVTDLEASTEAIDSGQKAKDRIARARQWAAQQRAAKEAAAVTAVSEA